ncbi:MAG: ABC transporter permease subunit [Acidimicrobiia bacterium]|nr:ABC transporter permease subunit [Acidimicrobiia bacterium]
MEQVRFPNRVLPYALLAITLILVGLFFFVPSVESLVLSFYRLSPFGDSRTFVGLDNFARLLSDTDYRNSFVITVIFVAFVVFVGLSVSLAGAVAANRRYRGFGIYRTLLIWPYALSPAIAGLVWALLMDPTIGLVTRPLAELTGFTADWRSDGTAALLFIAVAATWKMIGYNVVLFLAGLQSIPTDLLEAALVDGATSVKRFWRITFPLLAPMTFFLFVMNSLYAFFDVFGLVDITTAGGPGRATDLLIFKLYRDGFVGLNTGFASAQSVVLFIFVAGLMAFQFRFARRSVHYQ